MKLDTPKSKYSIGDLIVVDSKRKFPIVLRDGPGYTCLTVDPLEPGNTGLVIDSKLGHGMMVWINVFVCSSKKKGWIPESIVDEITNLTK